MPAQISVLLPSQEGEVGVAVRTTIVGRLDMGVIVSLLWRIIKRRVGATCNESQVTPHSWGASRFVPSDITSYSVVWHAISFAACVVSFSRLSVGGMSSRLPARRSAVMATSRSRKGAQGDTPALAPHVELGVRRRRLEFHCTDFVADRRENGHFP